MVALVKGEFLEKGTFSRKTGEVVPYIKILTPDDSVIQITHFVANTEYKRHDPVSVNCRIRSTKFGLMVEAVKD